VRAPDERPLIDRRSQEPQGPQEETQSSREGGGRRHPCDESGSPQDDERQGGDSQEELESVPQPRANAAANKAGDEPHGRTRSDAERKPHNQRGNEEEASHNRER